MNGALSSSIVPAVAASPGDSPLARSVARAPGPSSMRSPVGDTRVAAALGGAASSTSAPSQVPGVSSPLQPRESREVDDGSGRTARRPSAWIADSDGGAGRRDQRLAPTTARRTAAAARPPETATGELPPPGKGSAAIPVPIREKVVTRGKALEDAGSQSLHELGPRFDGPVGAGQQLVQVVLERRRHARPPRRRASNWNTREKAWRARWSVDSRALGCFPLACASSVTLLPSTYLARSASR